MIQQEYGTRCNIDTPTHSVVGGLRTKTYTTKYTGLPCYLTDANATTDQRFARENMRVTHRITLTSTSGYGPVNVTITQAERVNVSGRLFEVLGVRNPGNRNRFLKLFCSELKA